MANPVESGLEPVFRSSKRRRVFRKRVDHEDEQAPSITEGGHEPIQDSINEHVEPQTGVASHVSRPAAVKNRGVAFTSASNRHFGAEALNDEMALVPADPDQQQDTVHGDRFVKPTGKAVITDDSHMYVHSSKHSGC